VLVLLVVSLVVRSLARRVTCTRSHATLVVMLITRTRLGTSMLLLPLLACPAPDDGATGSDTSTMDTSPTIDSTPLDPTSSSTSNTSTTMSTTEPTTSVDPDTGTTTLTSDPSTTGADASTSTTTGDAPLCEIMLPPPRECPFPAPSRSGWAPSAAPSGGGIDDYAPLPDEQAGGGFIQEPDGGVQFECDLWAQDCMDGEKCMPWASDGGGSWDATRCSPLDPDPNAVGDPCSVEGSGVSGIDDCDIGAMCWDVDAETNMGTCIEMCSCAENFPVCNTPNTQCAISNDGVLILCLPVCNPLDEAACPDGQGCYGVGDSFQCAPDASGQIGAVGDECNFINACDPGTFCADSGSVPGCDAGAIGCCSAFCSLGDDGDCLEGQVCAPWFEQGQAPDECLGTIGACVTG
jgi:hypothetical protein